MANDEIAKNLEEGLKLNMTATGRRLGVVTTPGGPFYRIALVDGKQGGQIPNKYSGKYTSAKLAQADLNRLIKETWDVAEQATPKRRSA